MKNTESLSVIVPFSRPYFFQNVINNFNRQSFKNKRLIIVENGNGIGSFKNTDCILLSSDEHQSYAKNEGIDWVKKNGGGWWVTMDDDDYYGPEYLTEIANNTKNGNVIGKHGRFFGNEDYTFLMLAPENQPQQSVLGATIAARSEDSCEFKKFVNDDRLFCEDMLAKGSIVYATSKYNFVHKRYKHVKTTLDIGVDIIAQGALDSGYSVLRWEGFPESIINKQSEIIDYVELDLELSVLFNSIPKTGMSFVDFIKSNGIIPSNSAIEQLHNPVL